MTPKKQRRLAFAVTLLLAGGGAAALAVYALQDNVLFFYSPTDIAQHPEKVPEGRAFRIGGLVEQGSLKRENDGLTVHFNVTDTVRTMPVVYKGILPDLFKEGKGVVTQGKLEADNVFHAEEVLAKHDENYMPPEAKDAMDKAAKSQAAGAAPANAATAVK